MIMGVFNMALLKSIELNNGVVVNYHRIVSICSITNHSIRLEIASYTSQEKRLQEQYEIENGNSVTVYMETKYISVPYDEASTIKDWYAYLKTIEPFVGAEDA